jgi:hypothetical protein
MSSNYKLKKFIAYAKICSSNLAYKYVVNTNNGKDTSATLLKLRLLRSYIATLESFAGISKRSFLDRNGDKVFICIKTCLCKQEICNIVNKIKSNCLNC